jgi:hypothetical protein
MNRRVDPKDQFSKKLATWSAFFWFVYMIILLVVLLVEPDSGDAIVYLAAFVSLVMVLNIGAYTRNSIYDKAISAGALSPGKLRLTWKKKGNSLYDDYSDYGSLESGYDSSDDMNDNPEEESNG